MQAFGRACPWTGGKGPPPNPNKPSVNHIHQTNTNNASTRKFQQAKQKKSIENVTQKLHTSNRRKNSTKLSQSEKTFVFSNCKQELSINMTKLTNQPAPPIVSPDKNQSKLAVNLTKLTKLTNSSRSSVPKRKQSDSEEKWSREKIISELEVYLSKDNMQELKTKTEQELRKRLYMEMSDNKKRKGNQTETMDVGKLLMDSNMEYVPMLCEDSTDEEILSLEKHDAILELADFIRKCGKRVNFHKLNQATIEELHENIKIARDDHKQVKMVFPEMKGKDAIWFGPRSEANDHDYEPSFSSDDSMHDSWGDLSVTELDDLETEEVAKEINKDVTEESQEKRTTSLKETHEKLFKELLTQVANKDPPSFEKVVNHREWPKEQLVEEIMKISSKVGQVHYHSVLMNNTKEYLSKQLHSLKGTLRDLNKKKSKNITETTLRPLKQLQPKKMNNDKKIHKEVGSDGEYEWDEEYDTGKAKNQDRNIPTKDNDQKEKLATKNSEKTKTNKKTTKEEIEDKSKNMDSKETVFHRGTTDDRIASYDKYTLVAILSKRIGKDKKSSEFLLTNQLLNLQTLVKSVRDLIGLSEIIVNEEDIAYFKQQDDCENNKLANGKEMTMKEKEIPGSFDSNFTLPDTNETNKRDNPTMVTPTKPSEQSTQNHTVHRTFASVERAENETPNVQVAGSPDNNLNEGVDISQYTPELQNTQPSQNINSPPQETQQKEHQVVPITLKTFHMRVSYGLQHRGQHTPSDIKNFVRVFRSIDPQMKILPFNLEEREDVDVITEESQLPDSQSELAKWAVSIEISHNNKLHFSLRASSVLKFAELRRQLFKWCTQTKSYVKFDNITSQRIFGAGWLLGVHPRYHNRNALKAILCNSSLDLMDKIAVYPRKVWQDSTPETEKTKTNAIVIDGDYFQKDRIIQHLCGYKFQGQFKDVTFIPFKVNEAFTEKHQQKAMQEQNIYLRDTWSKVLDVKHSIELLTCNKTGKRSTFLNWMKLCEMHGQRLLMGVEYIDSEKIRIIYHKKQEYNVCNMLTYLFPAIEDQYGSEIAVKLLGNKEDRMREIKTKSMEQSYSNVCAKNIMQRSNPQDDVINNPPRVKFNSYYGKNNTIDLTDSRKKERQEIKQGDSKNKEVKLQATIREIQANQKEQQETIIKLNQQIEQNIKKSNDENSAIQKNSEQTPKNSELQAEIEALKLSQNEQYESMKSELNQTMDIKIEKSKSEIMEVVEKTKTGISQEIETLRAAHEESSRSIKEQQSANTFDVLTAISKINKRLDEQANPPISPGNQDTRHGGKK